MDAKLTDFKLLFSTLKAPPVAKLAIISSDSSIIPTWVAIASFFLSQLQILSVLVKTALFCSSSSSLQFSYTLSNVHKVLSVGDFLDFVSSPVFSYTALAVTYAYLTFTLFLLIFLMKTLYSGRLYINLIQKVWNIISYAHTLLFFYPIHTITLNTITLAFAEDKRNLFNTQQARTFIQVYSCIAFALNIFFAAITLMFLYPPIKLKFVLSSKTKIMSIISISHKLLLPLLWATELKSDAFRIFVLALNLIICLLKDGLFFYMLPYYNITVLRIASSIFPSLTLLALVSLISKLASYGDFRESLIIMFTVWVLLTPFAMKAYQSYLRRICHRILFKTSRITNPYYLIHYWPLYKKLTKERADLKVDAKNLNGKFFLYMGFLDRAANRSLELNQREEDRVWGRLVLQKKGDLFEAKQCVLSLFIVLLRLSARKNPLMILPKLWLTFSRLKYERSCLAANQVIHESLEGSPSIMKTVSFGLLRLKMVRKLKASHAEKAAEADKDAISGTSNLNMQDFLHVKQRFQKLKDEIKGQLATQSKFWKDFQSQVPEYDSLMNLVKLTQAKIKTIQKYVKDAHSLTRSNFFEPILILGLYLTFIQSDYEQGHKFLREYDRMSIKNRIQYLATKVANKRNSGKNSLYFVLSAHSKDLGKITSHAKNINQMLYMQGDSAVGRHINTFAASQAENRPGSILGASLQDPKAFEEPIEVRLTDAKGYLALYWMTITLNFLQKTGLSVCIQLKPSEDTHRAILINNTGAVIQCSEDIEDELEFSYQEKKGGPNMFSLCPHLSVIVQAFRNASREEELKVRINHIENHFNKSSEGLYITGRDYTEDEVVNEAIGKDGGFQRLYQKYSQGDTLIFYPTTNKKQESMNSLTVLDYRDDIFVKPMAYLATVQNCSAENEIFLVKLKEKKTENYAELYASLDSALKSKGMKPSLNQQLTPSSGTSSKNPGNKMISTKVTNQHGSNLTGSKPSLHNIDAQLEEIKEMETEEANHAYARSSCHVPTSVEIKDRYNDLLQKEYDYEDNMAKNNKGTEPSLPCLSPERKIIKVAKTPSDNRIQGTNVPTRNPMRKPSATQTASKILLSNKRAHTKDDGHDKQSNGGSSVSSQLNRSTKPEKIVRNILVARRRSKSTIVYASYFLIVVASLLGFLLWFSLNASTVSHTVSSVSDTLQNLYFRCYWSNLANQETRLWVGVKGGIATEFTNVEIQVESTNLTFHRMAEYNNKLRDTVSQLDENLQKMFAEKNVRVYIRDDNNKLVLRDTTDTFTVITQMLNLGFVNVYTEVVDGEIYEDYINPESRFIFDNTYDDLLIENEHLIEVMKEKVYDTFDRSERTNAGIVGVAIAISGLFILASLAYILMLNKDTYRFTTILFTLPHEDAHLIEHTLFAFQDMMDKELEGFDCLEALDDVKIMNRARANIQKMAEKNEKVKQVQTTRNANLFKYNKRNWLLFLRLTTIQLVIFGLLIFFYSWSLRRIKTLKQQQVIINTSLESINLQSLISVELQAMSMDNSTTTVRHGDIFPTLQSDVNKLSQLTELEETMRNEKNELPDSQKAILINFDCKKANSPLYMLTDGIVQKECNDLSTGTGYTGLLKLIADMSNQLVDYLIRYDEADKDEETLASMYIESVMNIMGYIDVTTTLFLLSYTITQDDFVHSVNDLLGEGPILSGIAGAVVPVLALWSWFYVIRWLARKEFDKKEMLELVPPKMILSNRHLKHYIFRIASKKDKGHSLLR